MADFNIAYKEKISSLKLNKKTQDIVGKNVFLGEPTIQINKGTYTENVSLQATFEISDTKMIITGCLITISEQESYSVLITKEAPVAAIVYEYGEENKISVESFENEENLPENALLIGKVDFSDEGNLKEDFKYILTLSDLDTELKTYIKDIGLTEEASVPSDVSIQVTKGNGDKETINFPKATAQKDGLLSSEDKSKLDSIAEGANKYTHPNSGVTAGTYRSVSVNAQGHVTKGTNPTTLDGYGIKQVEAEKITGIIGLDNLPQGALERCVVVKNDEARFALTPDDVQTGDTVKVEGTGIMYFVKDSTKLSSEEGYEVYTAGTATSVPWSGVTGKPETFTPSEHTHTKDEITDFPDIDTTPTSDSDSLITSGGVYEALSDKADKNHTHPDATEEASGFMSAQDKMTMGMLPNYVVCDTASDVAVKDITLPGFDKKQEYPAFILYLKNGNTSGTVLKFRVNGADEITAQYNNDESNIVNLNSGWYVFTYAYGNSDCFDLLGAVSTTGVSYCSDDDIFLNYGLVAVNTGGLELYQGILNHRSDNGFRHIPSNGETGQILANAGTGSAKWQTPDSAPTSGSSNVVTSGGVYTAMQAVRIAANTDLNDIDGEGYYWCHSDESASATNKPDNATFFSLRVTKISSNVFSQELTMSGNRKFIRIYWAGGWTNWVRFATESDIPTKLPNPNALTIEVNGEETEYDGSSAMSVVIDASRIGAADESHIHSLTGNSISGILPVGRGGTGQSSVDTTPTSGSSKMVTSGGVYTALAGKAASSHTHTLSSLSGSVTLSQLPKGTEDYILTGAGTSTAPAWKEPLIKNLEGKTVSTAKDTTTTAATKAIIVGDLREREYSNSAVYGIYEATSGNVASGLYSFAEGSCTTVTGSFGHAEGYKTIASGGYSHAEGYRTTVTSNIGHAEGYNTTAAGQGAHAEGGFTEASGYYSHAEGYSSVASGLFSHAGGTYTKANDFQFVIGANNVLSDGPSGDAIGRLLSDDGDLFIVGNGHNTDLKSNAFRVSTDGHCYGQYSFAASGADFAEYFEWSDGNAENADRRGLFVTLDGEKIRLANPDDDYILGIVSAVPTIIGDTQSETWKDMYLKDVFGEPITEVVTVPESTDEVTGETIPEHTETRFVLNPDYDNTKEYVSRDKRPEWAAVGLVGKLVVVDDGTCEVNGYCKVANGGTATKSDTGYRVMSRLDDTHIKILLK